MDFPGMRLTRRGFLYGGGGVAALSMLSFRGMAAMPDPPKPADPLFNVIGPKAGYSPQVGTLVSMLTWMRSAPLREAKGLNETQLDYLLDKNANSIGALLLHLAACDDLYQRMTFDGIGPDKLFATGSDYDRKWGAAMNLGDRGRKEIKGHELPYYTAILAEVREKGLAELKKRDDVWLMTVDKTWPWGPTDNYCKWFHVCEHESHHSGQIAMIAKRTPGAKAASDGV